MFVALCPAPTIAPAHQRRFTPIRALSTTTPRGYKGDMQNLFASGLGLAFSSPTALDAGTTVSDLLSGQLLALMGTGSPELDYEIEVVSDASAVPAVVASVAFPLNIRGGLLVITDGYHPFQWRDEQASARISTPDGYYLVEVANIRCGVPQRMRLAVSLKPAAAFVPSDGRPDLF